MLCCTISILLFSVIEWVINGRIPITYKSDRQQSQFYCCQSKHWLIVVLRPTSHELKKILLCWFKTCCASKSHWKPPSTKSTVKQISFRLMTIKVFECLQFFYESLILVLKDSDSVFKALDIFLLLPPTLFGSLSVKVTILEKEGLKKYNKYSLHLTELWSLYIKQTKVTHNIDKNQDWKECLL